MCAFFFFPGNVRSALKGALHIGSENEGEGEIKKKQNQKTRNYLQQVMHINMTQEKYGKGFRRIIAICDAS